MDSLSNRCVIWLTKGLGELAKTPETEAVRAVQAVAAASHEQTTLIQSSFASLGESVAALQAVTQRAEGMALTCRQSDLPLNEVESELNRGQLSWGRYLSMGFSSETLGALGNYTRMRMGRFARNRSQRPMRLPPRMPIYAWMQTMGLTRLFDPRVIAYLRGQSRLHQIYR